MNGILVLYDRPLFTEDAATITDHIDSFGRYSAFPVASFNTGAGFPNKLKSTSFQAVVLHYTLFASGQQPYFLDQGFRDWLRESKAYKIAFFQDEHELCTRRFEFIDAYGVNCVYTCFDPDQFDATYRRYTKVDRLVSYMPAYVSSDLVAEGERLSRPDTERWIDVGYRTRPPFPNVGRGGAEKMEIGERFHEHALGTGLRLDIRTREQDRLYGERWYGFLAGCRGQLGTESGSSCVDLEDEVHEEYLRREEAGEDTSLEAMEHGALGRWDGVVELRTTSSRHFEAAAMRTCQVMYEGRYNGVLEADRHFLSLRKDFSNFDDVIARFKDPQARAEVVENAYTDLIASGEYGYERFIASFDQVLRDAGLAPRTGREPVMPVLRSQEVTGWATYYLRHFLRSRNNWLFRNHPRAWRATQALLTPVWVAKGLARKARERRGETGGA